MHAHEVISAVVMPYGISGIINFSHEFLGEINERDISNLYENILSLQKEFGDFDLAIGVGTVVHSMKEVNLSLQESLRAVQYKMISPQKEIFRAADLPVIATGMDQMMSEAQKKNLMRLLKNMDCEELDRWFQEMIRKAENNLENYPEGYGQIKEGILASAKEAWGDEMTAGYFEDANFSLLQLAHIFNGREMLEHLAGIILSICRRRQQIQISAITAPVQEALDYIKLHYAEAVTLEELADVCGLSPNYFSRMFREQIGETYIDYLAEFRLEQAKQLLSNTTKTIKDIANEIGYLDDKYFRKLFKNRFGGTPSAYRKGIESA